MVDKWWVLFFNSCRPRNSYNGIVFRISEDDLPAYFGHWIMATTKDEFDKPINSLEELGKSFRETIIWRIGETISWARGERELDSYKNFKKLGEQVISNDLTEFIKHYNEAGFMEYTLEDYQIVLSNSIPAKRIIKILPQGNEFGKVIRQQKLSKDER